MESTEQEIVDTSERVRAIVRMIPMLDSQLWELLGEALESGELDMVQTLSAVALIYNTDTVIH